MKYFVMLAFLFPMSIFANTDEEGDEGDKIHNIANNDGSALNLDDNASDSLLWTYPTWTYGGAYGYGAYGYGYGAGYLGAYYPSYFGNFYNPYSLAYINDFYGVPNYGTSLVLPAVGVGAAIGVGAAVVDGVEAMPQGGIMQGGMQQDGHDGHMMHKGHHPMMHKKAHDKKSHEDMPMMHKKDEAADKE